jgi:putative ABC transport system permease protein
MLNNYIKVALRSLRRNVGHTTVAMAGLSVGLAVFLLMSLMVLDELSFDRFHERSENLYRIVEVRSSPDFSEIRSAFTAGQLAQASIEEIPEVVNAVKMIGAEATGRRTVQFAETRFYESDYLITDRSFFEVFDFELLRGNPNSALDEPSTVVLTESGASKYFGSADPVGQTITMEQFGDFRVVGILADPPGNSHLQFNMLISSSTVNAHERWLQWMESWDNQTFLVYLELAPGASHEAVSAKVNDLFSARWSNEDEIRTPFLQLLSQIHFQSQDIEFEHNAREGDRSTLIIFGAISLFLLAIGAINYMNMATARSMRRAREVGLRKVVGGRQSQLIGQFLTESVVVSLLAFVVALGLASLLLPAFVSFTGRDLTLSSLATPGYAAGVLLLGILVGVVSGSYPALYLASFRPAHILSGTGDVGRGAARLRRVLVVAQFAVSIVMIAATSVVYDQLQYVQDRELGFNQDQLVVIDINNGDVRRDWKTVRAAFSDVPSVQSVTTSSRVPGEWKDMTQIDVRDMRSGRSNLVAMNYIATDDAFLDTYEIDLVSGRGLSDEFGSDSSAVVINEAAARLLGIESLNGEVLSVPAADFEGQIVGIVKDFHFQSLHESIGPLVLGYWNNPIRVIDYFTVRVSSQDFAGAIAGLREAGESFDPTHPFEYNILEERLGDYYVEDARMGSLFGIAAFLAVLIACLGLAGLASYTAEQRTKEIGLRKVLGASVRGIVILMSKEFIALVTVAFVVASPIAYIVMDSWLSSFAFRAEISPLLFAMAGLTTLLFALITVSYQSVRSALANPIESLRYE